MIFRPLWGHVCISHSQQKLLQRLFLTEADFNEPLLVKEDSLKANEFIDLSHETRFHRKNAETSFNEIFAN